MTDLTIATRTSFHRLLDAETYFPPEPVPPPVTTKYFIVQSRQLGYRFRLHQHPYVQPLVRRLIAGGIRGLEAADTDYAPGEISLPFGVDAELRAGISTTIKAPVALGLTGKVTAAGAGGTAVALERSDPLRLAADAAAKIEAGARVTLVEALERTPFPGRLFNPAAPTEAAAAIDTMIELSAATDVLTATGATVTLPAGTRALAAAGAAFQLPAGTGLRLLRRRMRPAGDLYEDFFETAYKPDAGLVTRPYPVKDLSFSPGDAYAVYNWELFFHAPLTIAMQLSKNQRFAEAQQWLHHLFDPTDDSNGPTPERYWKVRPFQSSDVRKIEDILVNLADGTDHDLREQTIRSIEAWRDAPFRPHVIARFRQQAYMIKTVMAYLDNLIAWGDSLFRQDTGEAIDEAMMLYVTAANILGPRPLAVPKKGTVKPQNYANLRHRLAQFGTVLRDMEPDLPFDLMPLPAPASGDESQLASLRGMGKALYFCVPRNDKLLGYWDTVADRLFKIRNSLNFQGIFRQLPLFEPPIDPAMLARATAAGLDIASVVSGSNQPLPLVRFAFLVQKALEIAQEVKSLGNSLLTAMEKEDGEAMALLRSRHEREVLAMVEHVKYGQLQESTKAKEGLLQSLENAKQRYIHYEMQFGAKRDEIEKAFPELDELDKESLEKMQLALREPGLSIRDIEVDIAQDLGGSGGKIVSSHEAEEMEKSQDARDLQDVVQGIRLGGQAISLLPQFGIKFHFWGLGGDTEYGGFNLGKIAQFAAGVAAAVSEKKSFEAGRAAKIGAYARRELDWALQSNLAVGEILQVLKQLRAAQLREAIAEQELRNHREQMKQAEAIDHFMNAEGAHKDGKTTNKAMYLWMKREVKGLYGQCFQFAFDIARKAERALQHELGRPDLGYVQFGYLSGKEGLLAGDKLYFDAKRMEMAYHEQNQREYELVRHVSMLQLDPLALIRLRSTGRCTLSIPEALFDMDCPGHYFRRLRSVALTIPCVVGPYASINCTLTLLRSSIRVSPLSGDSYARLDADDGRFSDNFGSLQSIVTSSAQSDSGLFEPGLRDERYLPFENSGAISEWQLQLPADPSKGEPAQFDYATISDVILHLRYTAREGGGLLRADAAENFKTLASEARAAGSVRLFSVRQEFPSEWAKFLARPPVAGQPHKCVLKINSEHYPFWARGRVNGVARLDILARSSESPAPSSIKLKDNNGNEYALAKDASLGNLLVGTADDNVKLLPSPEGKLEFSMEDAKLEDLWFVVTWHE